MAALLLFAAREQNDFSRGLTKSFVQERYEVFEGRLREVAKDYSGWSESFTKLNGAPDFDWAIRQNNFGPNFISDLGIDYVFVLDAENRTKLSFVKGEGTTTSAEFLLGSQAARLAQKARQTSAGRSVPIVATAFAGNEPLLFAATVLTPGDTAPALADATESTVVLLGRPLNAQGLNLDDGNAFSLALHVVRGRYNGSDGDALPIASIPEDPGAFLAWSPPLPGTRLAWLLFPWIALAAVAMGVLAAVVLRYGAISAREIEDKIEEVAAARDEADRLYHHDIVTGLPNRASAIRYLSEVLSAGKSVAVLFLDLDRFKPVNDAFGHSVGDIVLREVGRRLLSKAPADAMVCRIGGDEFLLMMPTNAVASLGSLCDELIAEIRRPIELNACEVHLGLSIGIAFSPEDAAEPLELIRCSDLAMFQAKRAGRNTHLRFDRRMAETIRDRPVLERDLWRGLAAGEFEVYFQPRFDCRSLKLVGFEALMRWNHPVGGVMSPRNFLELAEETGAIQILGAFAIRSACETMASLPDLNVSVNLSASQFRNGKIVDVVSEALQATGLAPERLELEVTETVLIEDDALALSAFQTLKSLGVKLALDDFGTGYSALGYLRRFPFDRLKIDRQFVGDLAATGESRAIVRAVIGLARALNLAVTAEGVETAEQLMLLQADQCDEVQGFFLGRPVPKTELPTVAPLAALAGVSMPEAGAPKSLRLN